MGGWFSRGATGSRGGLQPNLQAAATMLTLIVGDERIYPLDYTRSDEADNVPMADLRTVDPLPEGGEFVITAIWPDVVGDSASDVVLDFKNVDDSEVLAEIRPPFRLTEVAIK